MASKFIGDHSGDGSQLSNVTASKISNVSNDTFTGTYPLVWTASNIPYTSTFMTINGSTDTLNVPNIDITGNINVDSGNGFVNSGAWTRNATPHGYIDIGPANTSHAHIYTDRPNFYFNKALLVNGAQCLTTANEGSGNGIDADTVDGLHAASFLRSDAADTATADITFASGANIHRSTHSSGYLVGSYNSVGANSYNTNPIYTIGSNYQPDDTLLNNMYGIGYSHTNAAFVGLGGSGWGQYVAADGDVRVYLNGSTGEIRATGDVVAYASDRRLKENITNIPNALEKVSQLNGVTYDWTDEAEELGFVPHTKHETGVIAQEVQAVIPDAVTIAPFNGLATEKSGVDNEYLTVNKEKIVPLLIEAVKELKDIVAKQQVEIEELKNGK